MHGTVAVTGGSGKLGRAVTTVLSAAGWQVVNLDVNPAPGSQIPYVKVDLTDYGQVVEALSGIEIVHSGLDAVVHLAAFPRAGLVPNVTTFHNNLLSTFHVFQAATLAKIDNLVWASSETLFGVPFLTAPDYVPLDEDAPIRSEITYSLVKDLEEEMARQYCRRRPQQKMIALRLSYITDDADYVDFPAIEQDPGSRRWNLWAYIDVRDAAQAVLRALEYTVPGFDNFIVANADTVTTRPSSELVEEFFPGAELRRPLEGTESLLDISKARQVLRWEPMHSWRTRVTDRAVHP